MSKRLDAPDTIDAVLNFLMTLQSDGWCLAEMQQCIEYAQVSKKGTQIPVEATVTIKLMPSRG